MPRRPDPDAKTAAAVASYDVPVRGELHVHLDNGQTWPATAEDLARFKLTTFAEAYGLVRRALVRILDDAGLLPGGELTETQLNPVRYLLETLMLFGPDDVDDSVARPVADLERALLPVDVSSLPPGPWRFDDPDRMEATVRDANGEEVVFTNVALHEAIVAAVNAAMANAARAARDGG